MKKIANKVEEYICAGLLVLMLIFLTIQVISRFVFNRSNSWSEEAARYLFVWLVFVSASFAFQKNAHIKVDTLMNLFPRAARKYIKKAGLVVLIAFTALITYLGWQYTSEFYRIGQVSLGLQIKMAYVYLAIPVGFFLMTVRNIVILFRGNKEKEQCQTDY
jgi:TRAP-type C4-dicarboxylate transport system permease small subunit